jgi:ABC-type multidrug transport system fused ATPase/permease subunit
MNKVFLYLTRHQPELLSGSLRQNLDPFDQYDDAVLNDALHAAGLFSLQHDADEGRITLDSTISGGGSNLSVGQRQILALARAIVRGSKLLILDEGLSPWFSTYQVVLQRLIHSNFCYRCVR